MEFLLKYSPVVFREGQFAIKHMPSFVALIGLLALLLFVLWMIYLKTTLQVSRLLKNFLIALKIAVIALLVFALLEPIINVSKVIPRKSSLLLFVDDSKSMSIPDTKEGGSRIELVKKLLGGEKNPGLLNELEKNFKIQLYRFSSEVGRLSNPAEVTAHGSETNVADCLDFAMEVGNRDAVAGAVLFTDGADNGGGDPLEHANFLQSKRFPVYTVGFGSEKSDDIEISKITANHSVTENSVVEISALIKNHPVESKEITLELREEGAIVKQKTEVISGTASRIPIKFSPRKRGFVRYTLSVKSNEKEIVTENNSKSFLIDNRDKSAKVLYIEGHPRDEFKYLRRAFHQDTNIKLVSLLRTGFPDKFYRQGIESRDELKHGYPQTKEDLFKYEAIIFGQIEAEYFREEQLQYTLDFVAQRGGGFLMLGGMSTFSLGGYEGTPIEKLLPVEISHRNALSVGRPATLRDKFKLVLTPEGLRSPILRLATDESENESLWGNMPDLVGYNTLGRAKPGATVLAVHPLGTKDNPKIVLANQRYGRGRSMVMATPSTWHWQMSMPHQDMSHERFWRQMLRWLALNSPKQIECRLDKESFTPFEEVTLKVDVRDSTFNYIENAAIKTIITTPSGKTIKIPFNWSSNGKVEYIGKFHPEELGLYTIEILAYSPNGDFIDRTEKAFFVEESMGEFTQAQLQSGLLKRIAEISGGQYFHQNEAQSLPDEIAVKQSSYSKLVEHDLWDMPLIFLLAIFLLTIEWTVRRSKGLS